MWNLRSQTKNFLTLGQAIRIFLELGQGIRNLACAIASAKSLSSMRGASHQSACISCLTISNTRLPYLPSG